jgi:site-specific DNA-methyltransferase (cytosine-N4-specific)
MRVDYLSGLDWDAQHADTRYMTHGFHQYASKYIPQIPFNLISKLSNKNDLVLDNFVGSGTTLVECKLLGRNSIGVDINPLACLISKVKSTNFTDRELQNILKICESIKRNIDCMRNINKGCNNTSRIRDNDNVINREFRQQEYKNFFSSDIPRSLSKIILQKNIPHSNILKWFTDNVICELLVIKSAVDSAEDDNSRDFLLVAFSSILRNLSNAHEGFGNLMRNKQPIPKYEIYEKFCHAVNRMIRGMCEFNKRVAQNSTASNNITAKVIRGDSRNLNFINSKSIDLICSHPPYMSAVPYAEYQKLSLWWLGYSPREIEKETIGGRRTRADVSMRFLDDMRLVIGETKRVLKPKKYCCIIVGNPTYAGEKIQLNEFIKKEAKNVGFYLSSEILRRKYRLTTGKIKEEFILIFENE